MLEPISSGPHTVQGESTKADLVVYVEELGGEGDYWLSITDAARVCRVQDVSIRRAIGRGSLPVRRQRAGQNKRTRFVRASDLPQVGFPIIDESAAITTEIGKADILSIPRQQQQIVQEHQQLLADLAKLRETITDDQAQVRANFQQQQEAWQMALQAAQEEQIQQRTLLESRLLQGQAQLQQALVDAEQRLDQNQQTLCQDLARVQTETLQREESIHDLIRAQQAEFAASQQEIQHALTELAAKQQQSMREYQQFTQEELQRAEQKAFEYQQSIEEKLHRAEHETGERLAAYERQLTSGLEEQARTFDTHVATLTAKLLAAQQYVEQLEQRVTTRNEEISHRLQSQQEQLHQYEQLLPLLPYAQQRLLTEQDGQGWTEALAEMEERLLAIQHQEQARYQPLLNLLTPEHVEMLVRLLKNTTTQK